MPSVLAWLQIRHLQHSRYCPLKGHDLGDIGIVISGYLLMRKFDLPSPIIISPPLGISRPRYAMLRNRTRNSDYPICFRYGFSTIPNGISANAGDIPDIGMNQLNLAVKSIQRIIKPLRNHEI